MLILFFKDALTEAKSNVEFLQILEKPCIQLSECKTPAEILPLLPDLFYLIKLILECSPFYNTM